MSIASAARKVIELVVEEADISDELARATERLAAAVDAFEAGMVAVNDALDELIAAGEAVRATLEPPEEPEDDEPLPEASVSADGEDEAGQPPDDAQPPQDGPEDEDAQMGAETELGS